MMPGHIHAASSTPTHPHRLVHTGDLAPGVEPRVRYSGVPPPLLVALVVACVYAALIGAHVAVIRRRRVPGAYEPRVALWLAAGLGPLPDPVDRRLTDAAGPPPERPEGRAVERLLRGELDRAAYRAEMAALAAHEATRRPVNRP
jgi:hypothetical protein